MVKKNTAQRWLFTGDFHCGHLAGLTPPGYAQGEKSEMVQFRNELWGAFEEGLDLYGPFDGCVVNGDAVDGPGRKSGGSEEITTDLEKQTDMAIEVCERIGANQFHFTYGTAYHTGDCVDFENIVAKEFGGSIHSELFLDINGTVFNFKHHTGRSSIPYGMNQVAKEKMWNTLLAARGEAPNADVLIRSHIHWFRVAMDQDWMVMSLPALQGPHSKYGRRCSGDYTMGFVVFDIDANGGYTWQPYFIKLAAGSPQLVRA